MKMISKYDLKTDITGGWYRLRRWINTRRFARQDKVDGRRYPSHLVNWRVSGYRYERQYEELGWITCDEVLYESLPFGEPVLYVDIAPGQSILRREILPGDEVEAESTKQHGIVLCAIRDAGGIPVCYKVWSHYTPDSEYDYAPFDMDGEGTKVPNWLACGEFDYIEASKITLAEPCGDTAWSLGRIGYEWIKKLGVNEFDGYYYNKETGDTIFW